MLLFDLNSKPPIVARAASNEQSTYLGSSNDFKQSITQVIIDVHSTVSPTKDTDMAEDFKWESASPAPVLEDGTMSREEQMAWQEALRGNEKPCSNESDTGDITMMPYLDKDEHGVITPYIWCLEDMRNRQAPWGS